MAEMIPHHQGVIAMARMELQRGQHAELKRMAQQIIDGQAAEITTMTGWLRQWYGVTREQATANAPARAREREVAQMTAWLGPGSTPSPACTGIRSRHAGRQRTQQYIRMGCRLGQITAVAGNRSMLAALAPSTFLYH